MIIKKNESIDIEQSKVNKLASFFKLDQNIIKLLIARGYNTKEEIYDFLNPSTNKFYNPYLLSNMKEVVSRIKSAVEKKEKIVILGDYDTDGISATAIMYKYFETLNHKVNVFLPNRIADGYGLSFDTIDKIRSSYNPKLIITVDCGISAYEEIEYAKSLGIEIIVTDHHDIPDKVPDCLIINPKMPNQKYPFKDLCGAGVALKVVQALTNIKSSLKYLTIASLATVADIVPLVDENRIITYFGIKNQKDDMPLGLQKLIKKLRIDTPLSSTDISFKLAPKINATGRMGDPIIAFNLYVQKDLKEINNNIVALLDLNSKRVAETNAIVQDAMQMLENVNTAKKGIIIVKNEKWESGVLGIICSKLVEIYNKPACVLSMIDGELKGSLRSIPSINIYEALSTVKEHLVQFGGHNQAAGITLKPEEFENFSNEINNYILKKYSQEDFLLEKKYDLDLSKVSLSDKFIKDLEYLEPFGLANEKPLFKFTFNNVSVSQMPKFPNHIKIKASNLELIGFNLGEYLYNLNTNSNKTIILELSLDKYYGNVTLKGIIKYISFSKLNTTIKTDIVNGMYLNQLSYIKYKKKSSSIVKVIEEDKIYEYIKNENESNKFGLLVLSNTIESYNKFTEKVSENYNFELYKINNKTGINTLLFAPDTNINYSAYDKIVLLDTPIHIGFVDYLLDLGKEVIITNSTFNTKILKNLDANRSIFAKYHNAIKNCAKKAVNEPDLLGFYSKLKRTNPTFTNIKFNQFKFVLLVLEELGICKIDGGSVCFTDVKSNLTNSSIYNFVNLLINATKGE